MRVLRATAGGAEDPALAGPGRRGPAPGSSMASPASCCMGWASASRGVSPSPARASAARRRSARRFSTIGGAGTTRSRRPEEPAAGLGVGAQARANRPGAAGRPGGNCSRLMPSSCSTSAPISWWERLRSFQTPAWASYSARSQVWALSTVMPLPRSLGPSRRLPGDLQPASGDGEFGGGPRCRCPARRGRCAGSCPGCSAGRRGRSRRGVGDGVPGRRSCPRRSGRAAGNSPAAGERVEVDGLGAPKGPKAVMSSRCEPHRATSPHGGVGRARRRTPRAARSRLPARRVRRRAHGRRSPRRSGGRCGPPRRRGVRHRGVVEARSGAKTRLRVCGKRSVSRAMGSAGRTGSVRVASTQASSWRVSAGSARMSSRMPRMAGERAGHRAVDALGG